MLIIGCETYLVPYFIVSLRSIMLCFDIIGCQSVSQSIIDHRPTMNIERDTFHTQWLTNVIKIPLTNIKYNQYIIYINIISKVRGVLITFVNHWVWNVSRSIFIESTLNNALGNRLTPNNISADCSFRQSRFFWTRNAAIPGFVRELCYLDSSSSVGIRLVLWALSRIKTLDI